jgi:hypothetical protein
MPAALVHCFNCRTLLNPDLQEDSVEIPAFVPLEEIEAMSEVEAAGYYVGCPKCHQELRVARKYVGQRVQCKFCKVPFALDLSDRAAQVQAFFAECPECHEELRAAAKYMSTWARRWPASSAARRFSLWRDRFTRRCPRPGSRRDRGLILEP